MKLWLRNTLGKEQTFIEDIADGTTVNMYCCGPTVYDYAHIGNFRSFLTADLLTRVMKYAGFTVKKAMNITDVGHLTGDDLADSSGEDKLIKKAKEQGDDPLVIARFFEEKFLEDEKALQILEPEFRPRATDFIAEQIAMTEKCIAEDMAYEKNGSVYFRTAKYKEYGKLSGNDLEKVEAGARVEVNTEKEDPRDFALWKSAPENHLLQWDSPWGKGFPGWHIECSAMGYALFDNIHIHTGGEDNIFPHHECEMAQNSACGHGQIPLWIHTKHLLVNGQKMSKSKGSFYTIRDLMEKGWKGPEIRLALLSGHYRSSLNFSEKSLHQARVLIARVVNAKRVLSYYKENGKLNLPIAEVKKSFAEALFADLNVPEALAIVSALLTATMRSVNQRDLSQNARGEVLDFFEEHIDPIFAIIKSSQEEEFTQKERDEIEALLDERKAHREAKNYRMADEVREKLTKMKIEVLDTPDGSLYKRVG